MNTRLQLAEAELHYKGDMQIFTAVSGPVEALREVYLCLYRDAAFCGAGELRLNMPFATGLEPQELLEAVCDSVPKLDWSAPFSAILDEVHTIAIAPAVRGLIDMALHDALARSSNQSVCQLLGGQFKDRLNTNQCVFWCDDNSLIDRVETYLARGFTDIKLRVGISSFEHDRARLEAVRKRLPDTATLAVDVNGAWTVEETIQRLPALEALELHYLEQPIAPGNWEGLTALLARTPFPIMLDEDITGQHSVTRLLSLEGPVAAHLKIPKLGGLRPLCEVAARLDEAGVPYMLGQMNEGGYATAAIVHCAAALSPAYRELYGADGVLDDPASGLSYADGHVHLPEGNGFGMALRTERLNPVAEWLF